VIKNIKELGNINKLYTIYKLYFQFRFKLSNYIELTNGLNSLILGFNKKYTLEPRCAIKWTISSKHSLSIGWGIHGFMVPLFIYSQKLYISDSSFIFPNNNLDFLKSIHYIISYNYYFPNKTTLSIETYYQYLYDIPVSQDKEGISLINMFSGIDGPIDYTNLVNKGTGKNYGIEITIERKLSKGFYFLFTNSLFKSTYTDIKGIIRNTAFSSNFVFNLLMGKEIKLNSRNYINIDIKNGWGGSRRYVPYEVIQISEYYYVQKFDWQNAYTKRYPDYFRINVRISIRRNNPKYSIELAMDFINITNHKNIFFKSYDPTTGEIRKEYQFPFMPIGMIRFQF